MSKEIETSKLKIRELFEYYAFYIPSYQRPYVWEKDNVLALLEDIYSYFYGDKGSEGEYFIGSLVFCEKDHDNNKRIKKVDVIDGQQRLTTLLLIFTVIRDLAIAKDIRETANNCIMTSANYIVNQDEVRRVNYEIREDLEEFLCDNIYNNIDTYNEDKIKKKYINKNNEYATSKSISLKNMYNALRIIKEFFDNLDVPLVDFIKHLMSDCFVIYIKALNRADAFRIFMILNHRGVPLQTSDLLKAENLEVIDNREIQEKYAKKWEEIENNLKEENGFDRFLGHIRTIYLKKNVTKSLYDEFQKIYTDSPDEIDKIQKGEIFFRKVERYYENYKEIIDLEKDNLKNSKEYSNLIHILNYFQTEEWKAPLLFYYDKFKKELDTKSLLDFLKKMEQTVLCDIIVGKSPSERSKHFYDIIKLIEESKSPEEVLCGEALINENKEEAKNIIKNDSIFGRRFVKYLLLKYEYLCGDASINNYDKTSIEHVLPQNPQDSSKWKEDFTEEEMMKWTNNIANLVIVSGSKNSSLSNLDFDKKKEKFSNSGKISNYAGAMEVFQKNCWTPKELEERNKKMINKFFGENDN